MRKRLIGGAVSHGSVIALGVSNTLNPAFDDHCRQRVLESEPLFETTLI